MYSTTPMVCTQKCCSISRVEYMLGSCSRRGSSEYTQPTVIIATQPSAPECTWPIVQSV